MNEWTLNINSKKDLFGETEIEVMENGSIQSPDIGTKYWKFGW